MPISNKPISAKEGFDICVKCGKKKKGHYYRRIFKGGIFEFSCKSCMKNMWNELEKKLRARKNKE